MPVPVVELLLVFEERGLGFFVFDLQGDSLANLIDYGRAEPFSPAGVDTFTQQLLAGVAYLHAHGTMHGRIKPMKVMIVPDALRNSTVSQLPGGIHTGWRFADLASYPCCAPPAEQPGLPSPSRHSQVV